MITSISFMTCYFGVYIIIGDCIFFVSNNRFSFSSFFYFLFPSLLLIFTTYYIILLFYSKLFMPLS